MARLLETTPLDDITVAELCREAGVHRTTFYAHADDVHDFALAEFSRGIDRLTAVAVEPASESVAHVAGRYVESMRQVFEHVAEDRAGYRALFGSSTRGVFRGVLDERMRARAQRALEVWADQGVVGAPVGSAAQAEAAAFIAGALVGVIESWALGDDGDAAAAAARVSTLMPGWWPRAE
ncbi:hypothetical protein ASD61_10945 [Leifsonia sp. Root60]|nr:hypothetical protein ASD61_10945 [Leifsonia sp. Root60]